MFGGFDARERLGAHWFAPVFAPIPGALRLAARDRSFIAKGGEAATPQTCPDEISRATGAPGFVGTLMLLEARFWKAVWRLIRRG